MSKKEYVPEIIEAVDNDGQDTWYFALIKKDQYSEYKNASKQGQVDIKQNDKGALFVSIDGDKCGQIIDNGIGFPSDEQKEEFIKKHGIPKLKEDLKKEAKPGKDQNESPNKRKFD